MPDPASQGPFFVVLNGGSGRAAAHRRCALVHRALGGARCEIVVAKGGRQLARCIRAQAKAAEAAGGVLVGAGGDGTLSAVAARAHALGLRFAALPQGTFNFFGRNLGLSEDLAQSAADLLDTLETPVQVGEVNGRLFLVNASIGLYRRLLQDRELYKQRYGRSRLVALWAGLNTLLRWHPRLNLRLDDEAGSRPEQVLTLIAGNNRLQLEALGLPDLDRLQAGQLIGIKLPPQRRGELLQLALRGLAGLWENGHNGTAFGFRELHVDPLSRRRRSLRVGIDGEIVRLAAPLHFRVSPTALRLMLPRRCISGDLAS